MSEPLVLNESRIKRAGLLLVCFAFVSAGLWMAVTETDLTTRAFGLCAGAFFGLCLVVLLRRIARGGPQLILSEEGIRSAQWTFGLLPWSAISRLNIVRVKHTRYICLDLHHPEMFITNQSGMAKGLGAMNRTMGWGHLQISCVGLDRPLDDVLEYMNRKLASK